jgi:hypothetical protein
VNYDLLHLLSFGLSTSPACRIYVSEPKTTKSSSCSSKQTQLAMLTTTNPPVHQERHPKYAPFGFQLNEYLHNIFSQSA